MNMGKDVQRSFIDDYNHTLDLLEGEGDDDGQKFQISFLKPIDSLKYGGFELRREIGVGYKIQHRRSSDQHTQLHFSNALTGLL